ncbi:hypothetical protein BpHYR1_050122 [Brachionus plicatilis]|uniref:Uncharacterized protein n=1 Tax=Brachionus plicatilis TaxID=10195 RepID=A0A3M7RDA7_BRAPC|nr:hypothetical protein BpHYR1_050122 [Brachionus plicatilis]
MIFSRSIASQSKMILVHATASFKILLKKRKLNKEEVSEMEFNYDKFLNKYTVLIKNDII